MYFHTAKLIIFVCLIALAASNGTEADQRIIGGKDVDIANVPHLVSIHYKKNSTATFEHRCSGTIYSTNVILTTATCVIGLEANQLLIVAGTRYRSQNDGYLYLVDKYIIHPDFNIWFTDNDLAILHLAFDLITTKPNSIAPIAVALEIPMDGTLAQIAGWGVTSASQNVTKSETLQLASVRIISLDICKQSYGVNRITAAMLCAGSTNINIGDYIDACLGDAGGALVVNRTAVGLVSWGSGCGRKDFPGVYTNLVHFLSWIEKEVEEL